jgi:hypothetical protein
MVMERERKLLERAVAVVNDHSRDIAYSYDRASDTMMVHFFGTPRPAVSIAIDNSDDALYVRLDRAADEVVGLQIEGFLTSFIVRHPDWADTLLIARLRGITREQTPEVAAVAHLLECLIA